MSSHSIAQTTDSAGISAEDSRLIAIHRCLIAGSRSPIEARILPDSNLDSPIMSDGCPLSEEISERVTKDIMFSPWFRCHAARFSNDTP